MGTRELPWCWGSAPVSPWWRQEGAGRRDNEADGGPPGIAMETAEQTLRGVRFQVVVVWSSSSSQFIYSRDASPLSSHVSW